jgi:hypothetical protein
MQYLVIETFIQGPEPVYARFAERGRLAPDGLRYVSSVVASDGTRCYQLMECDDRQLLDEWMSAWSDLVSFETHPAEGYGGQLSGYQCTTDSPPENSTVSPGTAPSDRATLIEPVFAGRMMLAIFVRPRTSRAYRRAAAAPSRA